MTIQLGDASANPVFTDVVSQNASLNANGATSVVQIRGQSVIGVQLTGTWTATIQFEGTIDGTNFFSVLTYPLGGGAPVTSTAANGQWQAEVAGLYQFRLRISAFTSGPALASTIANQGGDIPNAISTTGSVREDLISVAGTALGTPTNFGTSPGAVIAESVNASVYIGTTVAVAASAGVQKVGIAGGAAGAAIDGAIAAAPPANALQIAPKATTTNPANATTGNAVALMADKAGRLVVTPGNIRELVAAQTTVISASTAETTIVTAGGANVFNDLAALHITTTNAAAAVITIKDATAGTTRLTFEYPGAAANPGAPIICSFVPPIPAATANANWTATVSVNAGAVAINAVFVKNL